MGKRNILARVNRQLAFGEKIGVWTTLIVIAWVVCLLTVVLANNDVAVRCRARLQRPWNGEHGMGKTYVSSDCQPAQIRRLIVLIVVGIIHFAFVIVGVLTRTSLRKRFSIRGKTVWDVLLWIFCSTCALCQETRTLLANNVRDGVWSSKHTAAADPLQAPQPQGVELA